MIDTEAAERTALSFEQERLWLLEQLHPGRAALNVPMTVRLRGELNVVALRAALQVVVRRHEPLRTIFHRGDDPSALILPHVEVELPVVEPPAGGDWRQVAQEAVARPFDPTRPPLFRAMLIRVGLADHVFVLVAHHAVLDRWSLSLLFQELALLYRPDGTRGAELPPLPARYRDYVSMQRRSGDELANGVAYWRDTLSGAHALEIPTDRPRPAVSRHRADTVATLLPAGFEESLGKLARRMRATPFMTVLAAVNVVLARWSGETDLSLGTPVVTRTRTEFEPLIGMFLNNLVMRSDLSGSPTFPELVGRVRKTVLGAFAQQGAPFSHLVRELRPRRSPNRTPFFQVAFNMLNVPAILPDLRDLECVELPPPAGGAHYDLSLYYEPTPRGTELSAVFDADLYRQDTMRSMLEELVAYLGQLIEDPERPIGAPSLVTASAREVLPDPAAPLKLPWPGTVPQLMGERAAAAPHRVAVRSEQGELTYREVDSAADRVAAHLLDSGVGPGDSVAILASRHADLVAALMGTMRAGAAFIVLDPAHPPARNRAQVERAKPVALLATGGVTVPEGLEPPLVDCSGAEYGRHDRPELGADDRAYLAFTSGSQGSPKAVIANHGCLTRFLPWTAENFGIGPEDRFSVLSGLGHDPLHRDVFTPLALGAQLVIPNPARLSVPGWLADWYDREQITVTHLTPATAAVIVGGAGAERDPIKHLRLAFFTGEPLRRSELAAFQRLFPNARCVNSYGTTETSRAVALREVSAVEAEEWQIAPLGRGIPGVQLLILAGHGGLAGVGELGELCFRSSCIADGYLDGDQGGFGSNPVTGHLDDRIYRTGDLGRYTADGEILLVGRRDEQVQIRGFRVEPREVQRALEEHEGVNRGVIVVRTAGLEEPRLAAYAEPVDGWQLSEGTLRGHLRRRLPEAMIPAEITVVDRLPVTPNGKIDKARLPEAVADRIVADRTATSTPPRSPLEIAIADLWAELLAVGTVAAEDNFFHLGGHSVLGIRFLSRLRAKHGVTLSLVELFEHPTVAELAAIVFRRLTDSATGSHHDRHS
ncbi:amino acid adenylation domain-containing protein [Nonomuraea sp. NPDC050663]|uniref:amino acid adenylation domain-containing protein n=1 Tax=Nonomuraea sp. NPDC050663 TaxID=3364370 RepID=UPI0037BC99AF